MSTVECQVYAVKTIVAKRVTVHRSPERQRMFTDVITMASERLGINRNRGGIPHFANAFIVGGLDMLGTQLYDVTRSPSAL